MRSSISLTDELAKISLHSALPVPPFGPAKSMLLVLVGEIAHCVLLKSLAVLVGFEPTSFGFEDLHFVTKLKDLGE